MNLIIFACGIILGVLVRDIKTKVVEAKEQIQKSIADKGEVQFIEPISMQEKFKNAKSVDDIISKFKT